MSKVTLVLYEGSIDIFEYLILEIITDVDVGCYGIHIGSIVNENIDSINTIFNKEYYCKSQVMD